MRLICPNCGAQYEVPDEVIPAAGRDVQCSNCGHTWLQTPDNTPPAAEGETGQAHATEPTARDTPATAQPTEPAEPPEAAAEPEPPTSSLNAAAGSGPDHRDAEPPDGRARSAAEESTENAPAAPEDADPPEEATPPPRKRLDPEIAELLREEAEREARARATESQPLETQPDLGLDDEPAEAPTNAGPRASRRGQLPDIDEINSSLRNGTEDMASPEMPVPATPEREGSFARGVALALLLGVILFGLYAYADALAAEIPAIAPALEAYADAFDAARLWAHETITDLLTWLDALGES